MKDNKLEDKLGCCSLKNLNKSCVKKLMLGLSVVALLGIIIFGYTKTPTSVKTEGESVASQNAGNIDDKIAKWVENNPQKMLESITKMQMEMYKDQMESAQKNIKGKINELENNSQDPFIGNKNGDIKIVEFFDYSCGYCKKVLPAVEGIVKEDKKVKVIFKEFPILGQGSHVKSKIALASNIVDSSKYFAVHKALLRSNANTEEKVIEVAVKAGINKAELQKVLKDDADKISKMIEANTMLATQVGIGGTPAFIIGGELVSGAIDLEQLKSKIEEARKK